MNQNLISDRPLITFESKPASIIVVARCRWNWAKIAKINVQFNIWYIISDCWWNHNGGVESLCPKIYVFFILERKRYSGRMPYHTICVVFACKTVKNICSSKTFHHWAFKFINMSWSNYRLFSCCGFHFRTFWSPSDDLELYFELKI